MYYIAHGYVYKISSYVDDVLRADDWPVFVCHRLGLDDFYCLPDLLIFIILPACTILARGFVANVLKS